MNVKEMIEAGCYESKLVNPNYRDPQGEGLLMGLNSTYDERQQLRKAYQEDGERLRAEFKKDALTEMSILDHPVVEECWALAWKYGYDSSGYSGVLVVLNELVGLLGDNY